MKKKIIILCIVSAISTFIIYNYLYKNNINILSIGDNNNMRYNSYINYLNISGDVTITEYYEDNLKISELLNIINNNEIVNNHYIKELINKADHLIINIGQTDIKLNNTKIMKKVFNDLQKELKKITDKKIIMIGIYNPDFSLYKIKEINKLDFDLEEISNNNNIKYLKINLELLSNPDYLNKGKFTIKSHKYIALQLNKKLFKNS